MVAEGIDLGELPLTLVDSSRIVNLKYDIFELWGQLRFSEMTEDKKIELIEQENSILFWQMDLQVQAKPLSEAEAAFTQSMKKEADFDIANNRALEKDKSFDLSTLNGSILYSNHSLCLACVGNSFLYFSLRVWQNGMAF